MVSWGSLTQSEMNNAKNMMDFGSSRVNPRAYSENPELQKVCDQLADNEILSTKNGIKIALNDSKNVVSGKPTLSTEYGENIKHALFLEKKTLGEIEMNLEELKNKSLQEQLTQLSNQ